MSEIMMMTSSGPVLYGKREDRFPTSLDPRIPPSIDHGELKFFLFQGWYSIMELSILWNMLTVM